MNSKLTMQYFLTSIGLALSAAAQTLIDRSNLLDTLVDEGDNGSTQDAPTPTPTPQITPTQIAAAELDSEGLPWDGRIHAGTKTKTAAGAWTKRKGVDDAVRDAVLAELRQQYPAATPAAPPAAPVAPAAPAVPTISIPVAAAPITPFTQLTDWLARNTGAGKVLTSEWVNEQFAAGNTTLAALAADQDASAQWLEAFKGVLVQMGVAEA